MKTMKRFMALAIALILSFALAIPASAANITIEGATSGTYSAYQIFDLELNATTKAFRYTIETSSAWYDFVSDTGTGASYVTLTAKDADTYYVEWNSGEAAAFATAALTYAKTKTISAITATGSSGIASLSLTNDGYYVMNSPAGTIPLAFSLIDKAIKTEIDGWSTTTIKEKADLPTISKYVEEAEGDIADSTATTATATIGATVYYKVVVAAQAGAQNYKVVDTLGDGFVAPNVSGVKVTYNNVDITTSASISVSGQVVTVDLTDYCAKNTIKANEKFVITYSATIDNDATGADKNVAVLSYGAGLSRDPVSTTVYHYSFDLKKTDGTNVIDGATFNLLDANSNPIKFVLKGATYKVSTDASAKADIVAGEVTIAGLGNGTYTLKETDAPDGYKIKTETTTVTIENDNGANITVTNEPGTLLPETGGIGTTIFYAVGGVLMVGALALVLLRKRTGAN